MRPLEKRLTDDQDLALGRGHDPTGATLVRHLDEGPGPHADQHADLARHLARQDEGPIGPPPDPAKMARWGKLADHSPRPVNEREAYAPEANVGASAKAVVNTGNARYLVKPYHGGTFSEPDDRPAWDLPIGGWTEMTHQALYHAAGLGDLHQQVHVQQHGDRPILAIRLEPGLREAYDRHESYDMPPTTPAAAQAGHRIGIMDWLTGNDDRHGHNVMVRPDGMPVAIDHGLAFQYRPGNRTRTRTPGASVASMADNVGGRHKPTDLSWWRDASPNVRAAFAQRLKLIKHRALRQHLRENFTRRADHLDQLAASDPPWRAETAIHESGPEPTVTPGMPQSYDGPAPAHTATGGALTDRAS